MTRGEGLVAHGFWPRMLKGVHWLRGRLCKGRSCERVGVCMDGLAYGVCKWEKGLGRKGCVGGLGM